jgi:hypothetical protein
MPQVGIRKHGDRYILTDPMSAESVTISLSIKEMTWLLDNEDAAQAVLAELYKRKPGALKEMYYTFMNENPMWHVHGILATAAIVLSLFTGEETAILLLMAGGISLYALFKRIRVWKKWAAGILGLTYLHTAVWMITHEVRPVSIVTSLTLSLISLILVIEWNKPSRKSYKEKNL